MSGPTQRQASWRRLPANALLASRTIRQAAPREYAVLLIAAGVSSLALLALMLAGRNLIEDLTGASQPTQLGPLLPTLIVLALAIAVSTLTSVVQTERRWLLGYLLEQEATGGIVEAAASVPLAEFESPDFQDHLQRSLRQAIHRPWEITQAVGQLASSVAGSAVIAFVLVTVQPLLIPAVLLAGVPLAFAATRNSQAVYDAFHAITPVNRERQYLQDVLTGRDEAKEVRAFESSSYLRRRYDDRYSHEIAALRVVSRIRTRRSLFAGIGSALITAAALTGLIAMSVRGHVSVADAAIGALAIQQLAQRVRGVNGAVSAIQESSLFLEDYGDFLVRARQQAAREAAPKAVSASVADGAVELKDVWFTYPGAASPALRGVNLRIEPGQVVALVGANGSGKTTVAKLVCNLYAPQRGHVTWGTGAAPRVGVIFQDFMRYELTARDNIGLGDTSRIGDDAHVADSARAADADTFLAGLPDGYGTRLSPSFEGGTDLSVGQWQRVAMARALFREAPLLVLDEPTASLDPASERELIDKTARMFTDKAVLIISHRFANVVGADQIIVLHDGEVVERGTHADLMDTNGRYAEMYRLQASTFGIELHD